MLLRDTLIVTSLITVSRRTVSISTALSRESVREKFRSTLTKPRYNISVYIREEYSYGNTDSN
jgi:hypothetical protein